MDYISREDTVIAIVEMSLRLMSVPEEDSVDNRGSFSDGLFLATNVINGMPAADVVERKKGKWIRKGKGEVFGSPIYKCSCCNQGEFGNLFICGASYCPNCGAKMEGNE